MGELRTARGERHSKPKSLHHIEVKEAENGGHVVTHHFTSDGEYREPEVHSFGAEEGGKAMEHIASAAKIKSDEPETEEA